MCVDAEMLRIDSVEILPLWQITRQAAGDSVGSVQPQPAVPATAAATALQLKDREERDSWIATLQQQCHSKSDTAISDLSFVTRLLQNFRQI